MKFTAIGRTMSDETTPFAVSDYNAKTIVEFINEVLENKSEWGYIEVKDEPAGEFHLCTHIEYRHGELLDEIPDAWQYRIIKEITACGGWSRMDYRIIPVR